MRGRHRREGLRALWPSGKRNASSIEASNVRQKHEWPIWKDVKLPAEQKIIPGVVAHATNVVEHSGLGVQRIQNFTSPVGRGKFNAGTECGFSQDWSSPRTHPEVWWANPVSLVEATGIASRRLWER
jgi:5-methyltetrahydropteroyltriglutamate--homocysteine methyltransferase